MDYDELLVKYLGEFGFYQRILMVLICSVGIPFAFNTMSIVFIMGVPDQFHCHIPHLENLNLSDPIKLQSSIPLVIGNADGGDIQYSQCLMYDRNYSTILSQDILIGSSNNFSVVECQHGWYYEQSLYQSTAVMEWDLVCDSSLLRATASSVYMAGIMIGVMIFGSLSDRFGRRPALLSALLLMVLASTSTTFVNSYTQFTILRFVTAIATGAQYTIGVVLAIELVGPKWRAHTATAVQYCWAIGYIIVAGVAYMIREWRLLQLVLSVPSILLLSYYFIIPESPRWLYANNKHKLANQVVKKIAKINKVQLPEELHVEIQMDKAPAIWGIFKTPQLRYRTLITFFIWFVNSVVYFGLSLNTSKLGGNPYINFFIAGGLEIPAYMFTQIITTALGRKASLSSTLIASGVSLLLISAVPAGMDIAIITLAMMGKFAITISFAVIYIITAELYPTKMRTAVVGAGSCCARVGGVLAPYIDQLGQFNKLIPPVMYGSLAVLAGLLTLVLPETKNKNLPQTLRDLEELGGSSDSVKTVTDEIT